MKNIKAQHIFAVAIVVLLIILCSTMAVMNKKDNSNLNRETEISSTSEAMINSDTSDNPTSNDNGATSAFGEETTTRSSSSEEETTNAASVDWKSYSIKERQEKIDLKADFPFIVRVNRAKNWAIVFGMDKEGHYSVPYKIFLCSTGLYEDYTPLGCFSISDKYDWRLMVDGSYAQYAIRINGPIMLHSVPYYSPHKDDLEVEEYAKLGSPASLGCIRFNVKNVKWIYENCPVGTKVIVYEDAEEEPILELPKKHKAKSTGPKAGWDPTDPDENNPWKKNANTSD